MAVGLGGDDGVNSIECGGTVVAGVKKTRLVIGGFSRDGHGAWLAFFGTLIIPRSPAVIYYSLAIPPCIPCNDHISPESHISSGHFPLLHATHRSLLTIILLWAINGSYFFLLKALNIKVCAPM